MNRATFVALATATAITSAAGIRLGAADEPSSEGMQRAAYLAARERIDHQRGAGVAACAKRPASERDGCEAQANARADMRAADLEMRYRHTPDAARDAQRARIELRHQAALARCVPLRGYDHDQCLIAAHVVLGRALLESQAPYTLRAD
ncbi:MAG TPA: hypothetical protein VN782_04015 [Usitatibacter sp.]|nr:hypothetical protein [Usitatibacter sp.]